MIVFFLTLAVLSGPVTEPDRVALAELVVTEVPSTMPIEWRERPQFKNRVSDRLESGHKWAIVECFQIARSGSLRDCRARDWTGADAEADRVALAAVRRSYIRVPAEIADNEALMKSAAVAVTIRFDGLTTAPEVGINCPTTICFIH